MSTGIFTLLTLILVFGFFLIFKRKSITLLILTLFLIVFALIFYPRDANIILIDGNTFHYSNGNYAVVTTEDPENNIGRYKLYSRAGNLINKGNYEYGNFIKEKIKSKYENYYAVKHDRGFYWSFVFGAITVLIIAYLYFFLMDDIRKIKELRRNYTLVPISYLGEKRRNEFLSQYIGCGKCGSQELKKIKSELFKDGIQLITLICKKCKVEQNIQTNKIK